MGREGGGSDPGLEDLLREEERLFLNKSSAK